MEQKPEISFHRHAQRRESEPLGRRIIDRGLCGVILLFLSITLPIILFGTHETIYSFDHANYHLPAIRQIRAKWPRLDLATDTLSAIAPGYHYFLATVSLAVGDRDMTLRFVNLLVSLMVPVTLYLYARKNFSSPDSFLVVVPLVTSNFFVKSSCWVVTDNASLLILIFTLIALFIPSNRVGNSLALGALAAAATFVRQMNVWLAGVVLVRAALSDPGRRRVVAFAVVLMPGVVLACLYFCWGGLVPRQWREASIRFSWCPIAYLLAVISVLGCFYLTAFDGKRWRVWLGNPLVFISAIAGLVIAVASPDTWNYAEGRWGGYFWAIVHFFPSFADRSLFFVLLAPCGAAIVAVMTLEIRDHAGKRTSILWLAAFAGWMSVFLINRQIFQRYFEPTALVFLIVGIVHAVGDAHRSRARSFRVALVMLGFIQLAITFATTAEAFGFHFIAGLRR